MQRRSNVQKDFISTRRSKNAILQRTLIAHIVPHQQLLCQHRSFPLQVQLRLQRLEGQDQSLLVQMTSNCSRTLGIARCTTDASILFLSSHSALQDNCLTQLNSLAFQLLKLNVLLLRSNNNNEASLLNAINN